MIGLPNGLFWSAVTVAFAILPVVGSGLIWGPAAISLILQGRPTAGVLLIVWGALVVGSLIGILLMKPIAPINSRLWDFTSSVNEEVVEMVGWQDLTAQVAEIYQSIPAEERPRTVILTGNYGEAGALDLYGRDYDLPRVISGTNSQ